MLFCFSVSCFGGLGLVASRPQHPSAGPKALHPSQKFNFCSCECFDTCRPGGQPKVFPLDPLILFGVSTWRQKNEAESQQRSSVKNGCIGKKGAGSAEGEPLVCPLPGRCRTIGKPKFQISAMGAGPMVLPRGVGGEKPPTQNSRSRIPKQEATNPKPRRRKEEAGTRMIPAKQAADKSGFSAGNVEGQGRDF